MSNVRVHLQLTIQLIDKEETFELDGDEFFFGRSVKSTVHIQDPSFSRTHFKINVNEKELWISDLGSPNGTFLNEEQIEGHTMVPIQAGDVITTDNSDTKIIIHTAELYEASLKDKSSETKQNKNNDLTTLMSKILEDANSKAEQIILFAHEQSEENRLKVIEDCQNFLEESKKEAFKIKEDAKKEASHLKEEAKKKAILEFTEKAKNEIFNELENHKNKTIEEREIESKKIKEEHLKEKNSLSQQLDENRKKIENQKQDLLKIENEYKIKSNKLQEEFETDQKNIKNELDKKQDEIESFHLLRIKEIHDFELNESNKAKESHRKVKAELSKLLDEQKLAISAKKEELKRTEEDLENKRKKYLKDIDLEISERKQIAQNEFNEAEAAIQQKKEELESYVTFKKNEISNLEKSHRSKADEQVQIIRLQAENKKIEFQKEIEEYEKKVEESKKELSKTFEHFEAKKNEQFILVAQEVKNKEKLIAEIKLLESQLVELKIKYDQQSEKNKQSIAAGNNEIIRLKTGISEVEVVNNKLLQQKGLLEKILDDLSLKNKNEESLIKEKNEFIQNLKIQIEKLTIEKENILPQFQTLNNQLLDLNKKIEIASINNNKFNAENAQILALSEKQHLEAKNAYKDEMRALKASEEKRIQELLHVEMTRINKLKEDSLRLVIDLENSITKEISNTSSKIFANTIGIDKYREIAPEFEKALRSSLQTGVLKLLQNELNPNQNNKMSGLTTSKKHLKPFLAGLGISAILFGLLPYSIKKIQMQNDPIQRQLEADAQEKARALIPVIKFTPEKVSTLGANFTKSVIYTDNFCETYSKENFRSGLIKQGSVYLYKQWQIEEEKSIESYAIIFSLIDALKERREKINPEFEKRDIAKMEAFEVETMKKVEKLLGNGVRLEAAIKFQARYYQDFLGKPDVKTEEKAAAK